MAEQMAFEEINQDLPRSEISVEEKIHETNVRLLNSQFPSLDPLMCSVLLKCPPELMIKLKADPSMWITPQGSTTLLSNQITISDPPDSPDTPRSDSPDSPDSPRSVLDTPFN